MAHGLPNPGLLVSEENIFLNFSQSETRIAHVDHVFFTNPDEMKKSYIEDLSN
jgi:hypothetical protein